MHDTAATIFLNLDKSHLFLPLTTIPPNPSTEYLQCPATGHLYCLTTGSLYPMTPPIIPLSSNIQSVLQRREIGLPLNISTKQVSPINPSIQGNTASITPNTQGSKPPNNKSKSDLSPPGNSFAQSKNKSATGPQCNSAPTTKKKKKEKKKHSTNIQVKPVPPQANSAASPKKKSGSCNQGKLTVPPQVKASTSFTKKSTPFINTTPAPITQIKSALHSKRNSATTTQSKPKTLSQYNPFVNHKRKSSRYYIMALQPMTKLIHPIQIIFDDLLFPQTRSVLLNLKKCPRSHTDTPIEMTQMCLLSEPIDTCTLKSRYKPSLCFSSEDYAMIDMESKCKKRTAKRKRFVEVSMTDNNKSVWRFLAPFNRRPRPKRNHHNHRKESVLGSQCKNCIMASSVHEIIHSQFTKNTNEHMPVSQIHAMLSSGDRKLRIDQSWIRHMEEEAIHKYKKLNLEKHKNRLKVKDNEVLSHPKKPWLASFGRCVIDRSDEVSWPLLVKCLHKYPDSTLRQASRHRSFFLSWNETSYTLRTDHAYYTQIQCHMAITNTLYAELLVHTQKETAIIPVYFDFDFWEQTEAKLETFFTENVLPYWKKNGIEPNVIRGSFESDSIDIIEE